MRSNRKFVKAVVYALFLGILAVSSAAWAVPKIYVPEKRVDFGEMWEGTPAVHTFIIENRGDTDLIIGNVRTS